MYQRNTIQRKMVLDAVQKLKNHPTADEVYALIIQDYPSISKATVYRGLHELSEAGEIRQVSVPNGATHFDHTLKEHAHIVCTRCAQVSDVDLNYDFKPTNIKSENGFLVTGLEIVCKGICPNCQKL